MRKFLGLGIAAIMLAGSLSVAAPFTGAKADEATASTEIKPFALYEFQDESNPGKDTSGNGYDLVAKTVGQGTLEIKEENGEKYLSLDSLRDEYNLAQTGNGGFLYAPALKGKRDFSDMLKESFTVEIEFRRDNQGVRYTKEESADGKAHYFNPGDHYLLHTGRYNNSLGITPWKGGIEYQVFNQASYEGTGTDDEVYKTMQANMVTVQIDTREWTKVVVVGDADANKVSIYHNGELVKEVEVPDVLFSYDAQAYTFCIGAQAEYDGNACTMFATADVKHCSVYDTALSSENVAKLYKGEAAVVEEGQTYITGVTAIDTSVMDLQVTDINNLDVIMNETLPKKTGITLSDGTTKPCDIFWYAKNGKIKGYLQSKYLNPECYGFDIAYTYTVKMEYDENLVTVTDICIDDEPLTLGSDIAGGKHEISFSVEPANKYVTVDEVDYNGMLYEEFDGKFYLDINNGGVIVINAAMKKFTVTYKDGVDKVGTSKYTYKGTEALKEAPEKDGYTFEGWYSDEACSEGKKVEALDYDNPANITLYAKYVKKTGQDTKPSDSTANGSDSSTSSSTSSSSCNGSVAGMSGLIALLGAATVVVINKKRG